MKCVKCNRTMDRRTNGEGIYWFECQCGYSIGKPEQPINLEKPEEKGEFNTEANGDLDQVDNSN